MKFESISTGVSADDFAVVEPGFVAEVVDLNVKFAIVSIPLC